MEDLKERSFLKPSNVENKKGFFRKVKDFFSNKNLKYTT